MTMNQDNGPSQQWFPGLVALTDARAGHGGFRCVPSMFRDRSTWPTEWNGPEFRPDPNGHEIIEVPLAKGDLLVWDSHLPHGTVRNSGKSPRAAMYVQHHPPGTNDDLLPRLDDSSLSIRSPSTSELTTRLNASLVLPTRGPVFDQRLVFFIVSFGPTCVIELELIFQ